MPLMPSITTPGEAITTVKQLLTAVKVETDFAESIAAASETLMNAENLAIFYGYEGLTYQETELLAQLLGNILLVKNENDIDHVGRVNNGLVPVWPHNNTQGAWDMGIHPALGPGYKAVAEPGLDAPAIYEGCAKRRSESAIRFGS